MLGATCLTCEYTTVPKMLNNRLTANASKVTITVVSRTRTGIPIHRGLPEVAFGMLSRLHQRARLPQRRRCGCTAVRYNKPYVASRLGDHAQPRGHCPDHAGFAGRQRNLLCAR